MKNACLEIHIVLVPVCSFRYYKLLTWSKFYHSLDFTLFLIWYQCICFMTLVLKCFQELFSWTLPLTRPSYGRYDHEDWCTHKTSLCTWNLERRNLDENKPDTALEVSSCLMCTAFHPTNPALIAGGTYTGEE